MWQRGLEIAMSDAALAVSFVVCAMLSLATSWVLVSRLERVGARLGLSEGLLGILAALAADAPEITAAVTALAGHHARIGAGVVIGSNVFNLAALLGLAAVLAGGIALHRRVIMLEGVVALWIASVCLVVIVGALTPAIGLSLVLVVLAPYLAALGVRHERLRRLGLPATWATWIRWLTEAIVQEETELENAIHPPRGRTRDSVQAAIATVVVVAASVAMEQAASTLGTRAGIPEIVTGALVLAGVTSLPNAVAAVYLAAGGRGAATLSTAMNSNALNIAAGLLLPATIAGLTTSSGQSTLVAAWYLALTALALALAYLNRGLGRAHGTLIICAYLSFAGLIVATAYTSPVGVLLSIVLPAVAALMLAAWLLRAGRRTTHSPEANGNHPHRRSALSPLAAAITPTAHAGSDGRANTTDGSQPRPPESELAGNQSLVAGWTVTRVWYLAIALSSLIAAVDAILGHRMILIGLLVTGPCCALLTGRWAPTATAGAWAIALAVILGLPEQIWGNSTHFAFLGAVAVVAVTSTTSAALLQRRR